MNYTKRTPCDLCPFRNDSGRLIVHPSRLRGFVKGEFCCHKTGSSAEDGDICPTKNSQHCAGALIFLEKIGEPHQMMRIVGRLGLYDPEKLDMAAPVFDSWKEALKPLKRKA